MQHQLAQYQNSATSKSARSNSAILIQCQHQTSQCENSATSHSATLNSTT